MCSPKIALFALSSLALAAAGCASPQVAEPSAPSLASSYSAGSSFSGSAPSMPSVPHRDASSSDLVVRPDLVCVPFVLRGYGADPRAVVKLLEANVAAVKERFGSATQGAATLKMLGASSSLVGMEKDEDNKETPKYAVTVDGSIDVKLASDADYWARTRLVAALSEASLAAKPQERKGEPQIDCSFEAPQLKVSDPEAYRPELLKRWSERTRAFARGVESNGAPLDLVDCAPPAGITQVPLSLEQVGLSLAVTCHLDVLRKAP